MALLPRDDVHRGVLRKIINTVGSAGLADVLGAAARESWAAQCRLPSRPPEKPQGETVDLT